MQQSEDNLMQSYQDNLMKSAAKPELEAKIQAYIDEINENGCIIIPDVLAPDEVAAIKDALAPYWADNKGRSDFEGFDTERIYALLAKDTRFAKIIEHDLTMAIIDQYLFPSYLLWGAIAIKIHPGETPQHFHTDDESAATPRPRGPAGMSVMWALDDFTEENGATQYIPGSHFWPDGWTVEDDDPRIKKAVMKAGSIMLWQGTVVHRGGNNYSSETRLGITTQYCQPWLRPVENMSLAVPAEKAAQYSDKIRGMLGYGLLAGSFMGYVDGLNPRKLCEEAAARLSIEQIDSMTGKPGMRTP